MAARWPRQCPAGSGPDIDPAEFFVIPTAALHDNNGDGKFDRLDPALGFTLQSLQRAQRRLRDQLGRHAGPHLPGRLGRRARARPGATCRPG